MRIKGETLRAQQSLARGSRGGAMTSWWFQKYAVSVSGFAGFVWTEGRTVQDLCGFDLFGFGVSP